MYLKSTTPYLTLFITLCLLSFLVTGPVSAAQESQQDIESNSFLIEEIKAETSPDTLKMIIRGNSPPTYTQYETFNPFRIVIDVAKARFGENIDSKKLLPKNNIAKLTAKAIEQEEVPLVRFEVQIANDASYSVNKDDNSIVVTVNSQTTAKNEQNTATATLKLFEVTNEAENTKVLIIADKTIDSYNSDTVAKSETQPDRMFIDINNVSGEMLPKEKTINDSVIKKIRVAKRGTGVRIVFDSSFPKLFHYEITPDPDGLLVVLSKQTAQGDVDDNEQMAKQQVTQTDSTLDALLDPSKKTADLSTTTGMAEQEADILEKYDFSGYKKKRISIDFYKIDIHNIFRLLREITNLNIVVDEAVNGTLTLALSDVPWDFALDIILNLTNLEKEERYNTIVIYPKKKKFEWPTQATDNLEVKVDIEVVQEEELVVKKAASQPKEIIQAKAFLRKAQEEENSNNLMMAANYYEQALKLWPTNNNISDKLATVYLVGLRANAKAVNFAKRSLRINQKNSRAALYAAIGLANMNRFPEAIEYFNQSVSDNPPLKDALVSYATFSENNNQPEAALKLLNKYETHYGDDLNTMIAKARIYDKLGKTDKATSQYRAVLHSGFQLRPDMKKFIRGRIAAESMTTGE